MSRHADITLEWAGEERTFRLGIGEIRKLQERTDAGPLELYRRLLTGAWRVDDLRQTILLGLEGAKVPPNDAGRLVRDYVDERPLMESGPVALRILDAALSGPGDEKLPKSQAAESAEKSLSAKSSPSPPITDGVPSLASLQDKSTSSRSGSSTRAKPVTSKRMAVKKNRKRPLPPSIGI